MNTMIAGLLTTGFVAAIMLAHVASNLVGALPFGR